MDYKQAYELERSRRLAAEARIRSLFLNPILKLLRGKISVRNWISNFIFSPRIAFNNEAGAKIANLLKGRVIVSENSRLIPEKPVALIAHWSQKSHLTTSNRCLIESLLNLGFNVVFITANKVIPPELKLYFEGRITNIVKPNIGYDFGSWLAAIIALPEIKFSTEVILTNDSLIGPFTELETLVEKMRISPFEVTSLTDSNKFSYHLQSYFLHFKMGSFNSDVVQNFLFELKDYKHKFEFVSQYELEFTRVLQCGDLHAGALFPWNAFCLPWENPTIDQAQYLIKNGFPFLKKEFVRLSSDEQLANICIEISGRFSESQKFISEIQELA